ncbi:DUF1661 domain-containing protein [Porphyromonas gingivalis]|uniref:DUF1661 domain-containing protein n=1 Tax=Porphyromonas gingivalis TaxID=837 RepID=UPI0015C325AE
MRGGKDTPLRTPVAFGEVLGRYSAQPEQWVKITSVKRRKSGTAFLQNTRDFFFVVARDFFHSRAKRKIFSRHAFRLGKQKRNRL